jgi:hypothetical protein
LHNARIPCTSDKVCNRCTICFFSFGCNIGKRPWLTIILSVSLCLVCSAGNAFWQVNTDTHALWTPYGSPVSLIKGCSSSWLSCWYPCGTQHRSSNVYCKQHSVFDLFAKSRYRSRTLRVVAINNSVDIFQKGLSK